LLQATLALSLVVSSLKSVCCDFSSIFPAVLPRSPAVCLTWYVVFCRLLRVVNKHICGSSVCGREDVLFHFGLSTASHDLRAMFSDVQVCSASVCLSVCLSVTTADTTVSLTKTAEPIVVLFGWNMDSSGPNEPRIRRWPGLFFGYENYDSVTETLLETGLSSFDIVCANASFNFHLRLSYPIFVSCILLAF